jgi:hypothetical protein
MRRLDLQLFAKLCNALKDLFEVCKNETTISRLSRSFSTFSWDVLRRECDWRVAFISDGSTMLLASFGLTWSLNGCQLDF